MANENLKGHYVQLKKSNSKLVWRIPSNEDLTITTQQKFRYPLQELYANFSSAITSAMPEGLPTIIATGASFLFDLFGVKIFQRSFYAQGWAGAEPTDLSLELSFFRGMKGSWKAKDEVYDPIMSLMALTVPQDGTVANTLLAPAPSTLEALGNFGIDILNSVVSGLQAAAGVGATIFGDVFGSATSKINGGTLADLAQKRTVDGMLGPLWTITYGYGDGKDTTPNSYFTLGNLVCQNSSVSFSPQLEKGADGVYPISGKVKLTFKTQGIMSSTNFQKVTTTSGSGLGSDSGSSGTVIPPPTTPPPAGTSVSNSFVGARARTR